MRLRSSADFLTRVDRDCNSDQSSKLVKKPYCQITRLNNIAHVKKSAYQPLLCLVDTAGAENNVFLRVLPNCGVRV